MIIRLEFVGEWIYLYCGQCDYLRLTYKYINGTFIIKNEIM